MGIAGSRARKRIKLGHATRERRMNIIRIARVQSRVAHRDHLVAAGERQGRRLHDVGVKQAQRDVVIELRSRILLDVPHGIDVGDPLQAPRRNGEPRLIPVDSNRR